MYLYILMYLVVLLLMTWDAGEACICYKIGFMLLLLMFKKELLLVLVLNRIFRNLSSSQRSSRLLSYFDSVCFIPVFIVEVYSSLKNTLDYTDLLLVMSYC